MGRTAPQAAEAGVGNWSPEYIAEQQAIDPDIAPALQWLKDNNRPPWETVKPASPALRALWQQYESLIMRNGAIHRIFHNFDGSVQYYQLVLPSSIKVVFLEMIHAEAAGHLKFVKCLAYVQRRAWWYTWRRDLKLFIQCCSVCNMYHRGAAPKQGLLQPMALGGVAERWVIDLTGPHPMSDGYKYIFTAIDPFSKYAIVVPIRNKEATTVAKVIVEHIFLKWGLCFEILSDQGKEFEAELTSELIKLLGVVKLRSTGYQPSTQGSIERYHRTLNSLLAKVISETQKDWSRWVSYVTFCYNSTPHSSTNFAPHFIMTGQEPRWNIDFVLNNVDLSSNTVPEYTASVLDRLNKAFIIVRDHLQQSAEVARTWYNKRVNVHTFCVGDQVHVYNPRRYKGKSPKWQSFYREIAIVVQRLNDVSYVVKCPSWKHPKVVHVNKLKLVGEFK
jgi:transposase InsO family protein